MSARVTRTVTRNRVRPKRAEEAAGKRMRLLTWLFVGWILYAVIGLALGAGNLADLTESVLSTGGRRGSSRPSIQNLNFHRALFLGGWVLIVAAAGILFGPLLAGFVQRIRLAQRRGQAGRLPMVRITFPWGLILFLTAGVAADYELEGLYLRSKWTSLEDIIEATRGELVGDGLSILVAVSAYMLLRSLRAQLGEQEPDQDPEED